jgi:hypothetical protein
MIYLGIDPGKQGAACLITRTGELVCARKLPHVGKDLDLVQLSDWLEDMARAEGCSPDAVTAAIEALGSRPSPKMGASSAITMGRNWGRLDGFLSGLGCRYDIVQPKAWQKLICPGSGDPKPRSISACRRLFPALDLTPGRKVKPDDNLADAALIAEWARRVLGGEG